MATKSSDPQSSELNDAALGFSKGYNFWLWLLTGGTFFLFVCARAPFVDVENVFCGPNEGSFMHAIPGECWLHEQKPRYKIAMKLHLLTAIPAGFLVTLQFIPSIRHKWIRLHRLNGWVTTVLAVITTVSVLFVTRTTMGGDIDVQAAIGLTAIMFLASLALAIYNIKRLQIDQHRAWMLRAWFYAGSILTLRLIIFEASAIMSMDSDQYYHPMPCAEIATFYPTDDALAMAYPPCTHIDAWVAVKGDLFGRLENVASVINASFGMAWWLGLAVNAIAVEVYLQLTPAETERLRKISHQRQLRATLSNSNSFGLEFESRSGVSKWQLGKVL
ncbi:hypothetical protein GQ53DRAFT_781977 [Thozetella sp. PMI_491]|nr:hypothetical protein GQ53DRAFT_781977 [Thozetella sp. PMI_491]